MKIELSRIESSTSIINVRFHLESTDRKSYKTAGGKVVKLSKQNFFHRLPLGVKDIHPDIIALSILLVVYPFVGKRLHFPFKISKIFRDTVYSNLNGMYVGPEDESITPRKEPTIESGARPAMCFSNGVDSTAGLLMMPKNTAVIFHDHYMYPHRGYTYNMQHHRDSQFRRWQMNPDLHCHRHDRLSKDHFRRNTLYPGSVHHRS